MRNADASSLNVRSPRRAATATFALNAALCCRRVAIDGPPRPWAHDLNLAGCPDCGVHYTDHSANAVEPARRDDAQRSARLWRFSRAVTPVLPSLPTGPPAAAAAGDVLLCELRWGTSRSSPRVVP